MALIVNGFESQYSVAKHDGVYARISDFSGNKKNIRIMVAFYLGTAEREALKQPLDNRSYEIPYVDGMLAMYAALKTAHTDFDGATDI